MNPCGMSAHVSLRHVCSDSCSLCRSMQRVGVIPVAQMSPEALLLSHCLSALCISYKKCFSAISSRDFMYISAILQGRQGVVLQAGSEAGEGELVEREKRPSIRSQRQKAEVGLNCYTSCLFSEYVAGPQDMIQIAGGRDCEEGNK